jgi:hypothetical protein
VEADKARGAGDERNHTVRSLADISGLEQAMLLP